MDKKFDQLWSEFKERNEPMLQKAMTELATTGESAIVMQLKTEHDELKDLFMDMLDQGCGRWNREKDIQEYDSVCISTWTDAIAYAHQKGWITGAQVTRW